MENLELTIDVSSDQDVITLYDNSPDALSKQCIEYIVSNLNTISTLVPTTRWRKLKDDVIIPAELCERFLQVYQKKNRVNDNIANMLRDKSKARLEAVRLKNARITDRGLQALMEHKPREVELIQCDYLSQRSMDIINQHADNLTSLKFGPLSYVQVQDENFFRYKDQVISAPKLQKLSVQCRGLTVFPLLFLRPSTLNQLTHLDLTEYAAVGSLWPVHDLYNLKSLILHAVAWSPEMIDWIVTLKMLVHLDLSQSNERQGKYTNPNKILSKIVTSLPLLESLDISGTNLAGTGTAAVMTVNEGTSDSAEVRCDIPGLVSRVNNPLEFLGLYGTQHGACKRHDIPAKIITGDANEEQILTAAVAYMERPAMLTRVLNDLYYLFRYENNAFVGRALCIVLDAMEKHLPEKHIQISGSATLFYIVKGKEKSHIRMKLRNRIISVLLDGMETHIGDDTMMRNGCLTLCQFSIPNDVLFEYERVVEILLSGVTDGNQEGFVQRIAIYLLNSLACQVDGRQKRFLGHHGAITKMINLIADRLERHVCDDVLEVAWSTMWNVTDETPQNCQRFLENRGMVYFLACLKNFPDKEELLRNMMGLLGNVAEVGYLRPQLMDQTFLRVFYELLDSSSDGIEVSYNAAGVLAHMASDGPEAWTVDEPSREDVLERVAAAVERWDRFAERNINYRSFEPILSLLNAHHTPQCQHWAVWALANLTTVYPDKYCSLVAAEGGLALLERLLVNECSYDRIKELARVVLDNCRNRAREGAPAATEAEERERELEQAREARRQRDADHHRGVNE